MRHYWEFTADSDIWPPACHSARRAGGNRRNLKSADFFHDAAEKLAVHTLPKVHRYKERGKVHSFKEPRPGRCASCDPVHPPCTAELGCDALTPRKSLLVILASLW